MRTRAANPASLDVGQSLGGFQSQTLDGEHGGGHAALGVDASVGFGVVLGGGADAAEHVAVFALFRARAHARVVGGLFTLWGHDVFVLWLWARARGCGDDAVRG